jgi:hypothetical protein
MSALHSHLSNNRPIQLGPDDTNWINVFSAHLNRIQSPTARKGAEKRQKKKKKKKKLGTQKK